MLKRSVSGTLILGLLCLCLPAEVCVAQPLIEDADIPDASRELRHILYERYELREEIAEVEAELERLKKRELSLNKLVELQRQLDSINKDIDAAKDEGREFEALEDAADQLELKIEFHRTIEDIDFEIEECRQVIARLRRLEQEHLVEPVIELTARLKETRKVHIKLHQVHLSGPESDEQPLEERLDEIEEELELGRDYFDLLGELGEAIEEDDEEWIEELQAELEAKREETSGDRPSPSIDDDASNDPTRQPIPITEQGLATVAGLSFEEAIVPLLKQHCYDCHGSDAEAGELNLEEMVTQRPIVVNRQKWINVLEQAKNRVMPPEEADQPSERDRTRLVLALHNAIHNFDYSGINNPGYETARRLTHDEYDNTVRDLFGIDLRPTKKFPTDMIGSSGFDNSANTLFVQPLLMERYIGAAEEVVEAALPKQAKSAGQQRARELIFGAVSPEANEATAREQVLKRFLLRAFRRPATDAELARAVTQYDQARADGSSFEEAIKVVIQTTLISPRFLIKSEHKQDTAGASRINGWELGTRLSYFLWASMPDNRLFELAESGRLSDPDVLHAEVNRMIADEKSETLGSLFAAQWLGSRHLGTRVRMDPIDNPWCTDSLMAAMRDETAMFFHSLVKENQPIRRLIDADYTFMNEELAKHYKFRGVRGRSMQRVSLGDNERGGIFGHGSLLAVTSFPYRTSPVVRGKWILADVLGTPPPPPPPNVSELPEEIEENDRLTFREKLELHRRAPNCYACHSQMDPLGFSLEGYDFFGRARSGRRGPRSSPDVRGQLPNGTTFEGLQGLKQVIVQQRLDDLCKQVSRKLLSYALGRQLEYYDEPALSKIVAAVERDEYRFQTLIHEIVDSYPFQYKQSPTYE